MANNKDFKVKNGIKPTAYHEAVGTVTSGTEGYNLTVASYDSVDFSVSSQDSTPIALTFKPDGTKMYVFGNSTSDIFQYSLSTAWDLSTASYDSKSYSANAQVSNGPESVVFKSDGTKMFLLGNSGTYGDDVFRYTLSTAWDVSTASYDSNTVDVESQETGTRSIALNSDGTKLFVLGDSSGEVLVWNMSTAYDLSSASYDSSESLDTSSEDNSPKGMSFSSDGTKLFILGSQTDKVHKYNLTTAFDVSTASYSNESFLVSSQDTAMRDVALKSDGTKMYTVGYTNDKVYQYSTVLYTQTLDQSTGSVFEITPTSDIQIGLSNPATSGTVSAATLLLDGAVDPSTAYKIDNISYDSKSLDVSTQETNASSVQFNSAGTKAFVLGYAGDDINQYSLSTAWDISTGSFDSVTFSVSSQQSAPTSFIFKSDGTKFYVLGYGTLAVHQYDLTSAFDLSTASYASKTFSISQDSTPFGLEFKPDGTKMYVIGFTNKTIYQYALSTAFDVSTASYESKSFSVNSQETGPREFKFNSDGTKFILCGSSSDYLHQYSCSTAYDISTASYDSVSYSINSIAPWSSTGSTTYGLTFKDDGSKLYLVDTTSSNDGVFQYSTGSAATITYDSTIEFAGGTAPTSPAIGETDVLTFSTRNGGTSYQSVLAIDGAK